MKTFTAIHALLIGCTEHLKRNIVNSMTKRKHHSAIRLHPKTYEAWLKENAKIVQGGPIVLIPTFESNDENDVRFDAYSMDSEILPEHYAKDLFIFGIYNEFEGFKIWVTVKNYDYLLMAHQTHHSGQFTTSDGRKMGNHPHFHEIDYISNSRKGKPNTRRLVPTSLYPDINSAELLNSFMEHYYIEDGRKGKIPLPKKPPARQWGLHEFDN